MAITAIKLEDWVILDAIGRGKVHRAESGAIWYTPRFKRGMSFRASADNHRVDATVRRLRDAGLVVRPGVGKVELTAAGRTVLAMQCAPSAPADPVPRQASAAARPARAVARLAAGSDWRHHSMCRDEDPELFFPIGSTGPAVLQIDQAKQVCGRCPVATECLKWALETGQDAGVWGGMTEDDRRALKRRDKTGAEA